MLPAQEEDAVGMSVMRAFSVALQLSYCMRRVRPERERGHMPEDAYYGRPGLHDRHWEDNREHWEPARYRHPGNFHLLDERPSPYAEHRRSLEAHMHARSPPPPRSHPRMDPFAPHLRERSPPHAHAGGPWPPFPHDYLDDRPSPQRSVLVQRAGPEAERLVIRRPLSPEHHSPPESWYRVHPADRRVEYSPRPLPVYGPIAHHGPPRELLHEGGPHWHPSPERGLHRDSVLRAARGAVSPRPHEHKEPARAPAPRCCLLAQSCAVAACNSFWQSMLLQYQSASPLCS